MAEGIGGVPEWDAAGVPDPTAAQGRTRIPQALTDELTFELGERGEDVEHEVAHRDVAHVDVADDDRQFRPAPLERAYESRVVRDAPGQPVEALDADAVDSARSNPLEETRERGSVDGGAALSGIVEALVDRDPSLRRVGTDQLEAGLALRFARSEVGVVRTDDRRRV